MSARTLGPKGRWIVRSQIDWKEEQVSARTLDLKGRWTSSGVPLSPEERFVGFYVLKLIV